MPQDFPLMMYHIQLGQKVVKDNQEAEIYEDQGWIRNYQVFQKKNTTTEKIKYHMEELEKLTKEKEKYIVNPMQNDTMQKDVKPIIDDKITEAKPEVKKGRGRPKKEA